MRKKIRYYSRGHLHMRDNKEGVVIPKSEDRIKIIEKIKDFEKAGTFDIDPEDDPPTITLMPDKVDYLRKKITSKINRGIGYGLAKKFLSKSIKNGDLVIKKVNGMENFKSLESGAIITCNHFNTFDCFTV